MKTLLYVNGNDVVLFMSTPCFAIMVSLQNMGVDTNKKKHCHKTVRIEVRKFKNKNV